MEKINKLSLPATILIVVVILGGFYFAVEYNKQHSIEKQQQIKIEQEKQAKEETKRALDTCLDIAEKSHDFNWYRECERRDEITSKCIDINKLSFNEYLEKYNLTVEEYAKERNITSSDPDNPLSSIELLAGLDYMARGASDECSCRLPFSTADRLDKILADNKAECFKRYPPNNHL